MQMSRQTDSGRDTVFSSDGSSCCEAGGSSGSSSSGVGSSHTPGATPTPTPTACDTSQSACPQVGVDEVGRPKQGAAPAVANVGDRTRPPRITPFSGVLSQGKVVIRPIAFRPLQGGGAMSPGPNQQLTPLGLGGRLSNAGERYGSTPVLARPGSRLALHGSTTDLRALGPGSLHTGGGSHLSLDRKMTSCSSPPTPLSSLSSLPLPGRCGGRLAVVDPLVSSGGTPMQHQHTLRAGSVDRNLGHSRSDAALRRLPLVLGPGISSDRVNGDLDRSPADSDLEAAIRGRDSELALRQRDSDNKWARELRRVQHAADSRLRAGAQRVRELEHALVLQSQQLQQEKQRVRSDGERAERCARDLRSRLEETEWVLHQRNGEIALLKAQLKDAQQEQAGRAHEASRARSENRDLRARLERLDAERACLRRQLSEREAELTRSRDECSGVRRDLADARALSSRDLADLHAVVRRLESELELAVAKGNQAVKKHTASSEADVQQLRADLRRLTDELAAERQEFELERATWAEEKEKVLRYQRQLQLNYVQMFRRTRSLEAEVESLTMELELETKAHKANPNKKAIPELHPHTAIQL